MYSGGTGYKMTPEMELYTLVCASMLTPKYYVPDTNDQLNRIKARIKDVDPYFVAQLAVYAREKMYLRTIPQVLTVELAKRTGGQLIRKLSSRVIQRADEITSMLEYYVKANKITPRAVEDRGDHTQHKVLYKLSNPLRKGIADAFNKFDEYQFAKYNRKSDITLLDALRIVHPKPADRVKSELFKKIKENDLAVPYTWEVELSRAGQDGRDKAEVWTELIESGKLGYMAMLRNLRNFMQTGVSEATLQVVADRISDRGQVKRSKQLPFRFLSAYRMLAGGPVQRRGYWNTQHEIDGARVDHLFLPVILDALEVAALHAADNIPAFKDADVLMASDVSGSMQQTVSPRSIVQSFDIGALLMMLAQTKCNSATVGMFGDRWKVLDDLPRERVLQATNEIHRREGEVGYSTHGYKVIQWALNNKIKYDRVMIFTDCQMYGMDTRWGRRGEQGDIVGMWNTYKSFCPDSRLYLFDLNSYGQSPMPLDVKNNGVFLITGWSDKIFDALASLEQGEGILNNIEEIIV